MTSKEREKARKLCDGAAPPPWIVKDLKYVVAPCPCCGQICECDQFGASDDPECYHSEFIANARTSLPNALDQINADEILMKKTIGLLLLSPQGNKAFENARFKIMNLLRERLSD